MAIPDPLPPLVVDPRPYASVTFGWRGVWVAFATDDAHVLGALRARSAAVVGTIEVAA